MSLRTHSFLLFGVAFVLTLGMFILGWMDPWNLALEYVRLAWVAWALLTVVVVVWMGILAAVSEDSTSRWTIVSLAAVLLLMASGLNILSFGVLIAPAGIGLLAVSLILLVKSRLTGPSST